MAGDESIVDVEIACRGHFLIHIENKIWSAEGDCQTDREWSDLQERGQELGVPEKARHGVFLTLDGCEAKNTGFLAIAWNRVARVLDQFANQAEPNDVKLFARHYAKAVRRLCVVDREDTEAEYAKV